MRLRAPIVGGATDRSDDGYWMVAADGGVFSFDAAFHGSLGDRALPAPAVDSRPRLPGAGTGSRSPTVPSMPLAMLLGSATWAGDLLRAGDGSGYWLDAADGGVFTFGENVPYLGSMGGTRLAAPILDLIH